MFPPELHTLALDFGVAVRCDRGSHPMRFTRSACRCQSWHDQHLVDQKVLYFSSFSPAGCANVTRFEPTPYDSVRLLSDLILTIPAIKPSAPSAHTRVPRRFVAFASILTWGPKYTLPFQIAGLSYPPRAVCPTPMYEALVDGTTSVIE
jgi:hypothetical protein